MHDSYFSYNLSRPYPYIWFTPVVLVGGLIATALIAFFSVATQGYETISMATSNPNTTSENRNPFSDWPSFLTANTKSLCSTTTISIGTEFYTNNTALKYTVTKIWRGNNPEPDALLGSLPYLNNPFQLCAVNGITIEFEGIDRSRNDTAKAILWWGESLLAWYSIALTNDMHVANEKFFRDENDTNIPPIYKGHISFTKRKTVVPSVQDIKAPDFFQVSCFFVPFNNLAKAFYFTILADLGQKHSGANILDNIELLEHSTKGYENIRNRTPIWGDNLRVNTTEGLAHHAFTSKDSSRKNLGIEPSVISTTFLFQIPRLKSRPTLIVSVIINTIVILSALWRLYQFTIDAILSKNDPEMMNCVGCTAPTSKEDNEAMYPSGQSSQSSGTPSGDKARYSSIRQPDN
ncbi:hypothetical protein FPHYL_12350 [Fusarium phyllophilum]|uniref:Transmembrane protein n=1 Tax=Fusarium phyllophilum TaxID=47803 RepID=A0A8H5INB9_9HYPO|nr:hypothetical protein FPHYL_12350 [Fusarium phyllophilum]